MRTERRHGRAAGFTLIELMVVLAIVGIIAGLAVVALDPSRKSRSIAGYANEISNVFEVARMRAVSTLRRQRIVFSANQVTHQQATTTGLPVPAGYEDVSVILLPQQITIAATTNVPELDTGATVVAGAGLPLNIDVLPDGRARSDGATTFHEMGWTVFMQNSAGEQMRIALFGMTSTAQVFSGW